MNRPDGSETARGPDDAAGLTAPHLLVCLRCGFTYAEFRGRGLLGCAECYESFGEILHADMFHVHPRLFRAAPAGQTAGNDARRAETAAALRERLSDALRFERYEEAAALRRELAVHVHGPRDPVTGTARADASPDAAVTETRTHAPDATSDDSAGFLAGLAEAPVSWAAPLVGSDAPLPPETARLLFVRVLARRNFAGFPFWVSCSPETCDALLPQAHVPARAQGLRDSVRLAALDAAQRGLLRERMLLPERPVSFAANRDRKRLWTPRTEEDGLRTHALLGEVEHWTLVRTMGPRAASHAGHPPRTPPASAHNALDALADIVRRDAEDSRSHAFARSETWNFLTSHPAHAGHGLQFEAGLHLPALAEPGARDTLLRIRRALGATGYDLQALSLREPGATEAGFFRLASRGGAGATAEDDAVAFAAKARTLLRVDAELWERRAAREPGVVEDRMHRALRVLQEARRMDHAEAQRLVSAARTGVYAGAFPGSLREALETFRVRAQPFHVRALALSEMQGAPDPAEAAGIDPDDLAVRARLARRLLSHP